MTTGFNSASDGDDVTVRPTIDAIIVAKPSWREWVYAMFSFALASLILTALVTHGIDTFVPSFLSDSDIVANRLRLGAVFILMFTALSAWNLNVNRKYRYIAVQSDRVAIGRPPRTTVLFADIMAIRVGAPMVDWVRKVAGFNSRIGKLSPTNAEAARVLSDSYAGTVVIDTIDGSLIFHIGTLVGGQEVLAALVRQNASRVIPSVYSSDELTRFGRFKPGWYPKSRSTA